MEQRFVISPVPKERHREFVDFFYREFFPREPLALASGLAGKTNPGTIGTFMEWLNQDLSMAVIDSKTNDVVAGVLNCTLNKTETLFNSDYSCMQPEDRCIWMFLDRLEAGYNVFDEMKSDSGMELVFLCVKSGFEKKGFARRLTEATIDLAKQRNLCFIKTNPTTPATCHLFEAVGFETVREMKLVDFFIDQVPAFPFASIENIARLCLKKVSGECV